MSDVSTNRTPISTGVRHGVESDRSTDGPQTARPVGRACRWHRHRHREAPPASARHRRIATHGECRRFNGSPKRSSRPRVCRLAASPTLSWSSSAEVDGKQDLGAEGTDLVDRSDRFVILRHATDDVGCVGVAESPGNGHDDVVAHERDLDMTRLLVDLTIGSPPSCEGPRVWPQPITRSE